MGRTSYAELLAQAQPQIICNDRTHRRALRIVDALMKKPRLSKAEGKLLDLLAKLIDDYEESIWPTPDTVPHGILRHFLENSGKSQAEFARAIGISRSTISEVLKRKRSISVENAFRLAKYFHVEPTLFLTRP